MVSGLVQAAKITRSESYLTAARKAMEFVQKHLYLPDDGLLLRTYREGDLPAFFDFYFDFRCQRYTRVCL